MLLAADGMERIQNHGMALHERIEKMPKRGKRLVFAGSRRPEPVDVVACDAGRDLL